MDARQADVVVVGAGIMGASAAWHLARRGSRVVLLEQFELDHVRGSSHGAARIFRLAYDQVDYVRLSQHSLPLWREAEHELGQELLWTTGGVDFGPPDKLDPIAHALSTADVKFERIGPAHLPDRFSAFALPDGWEALYPADAGVLHADRCRLGLIELARRAGAEISSGTQVLRLDPGSDDVRVETTRGTWQAHHVVVAAAAWTNRLLEPLGLNVPMKVTREHVAYYRYRDDRRLLPFIWHEGTAAFEFYGLPNGSVSEVKIGEHGAGPEVDPDEEGAVDELCLDSVKAFVRRYLPALAEPSTSSETCLYASTPDDDFVIDRAGLILLGIGFGGHGFKFGAGIGALLADLIDGEAIPFGSRFSRSRFGAGALR